MSLQNKVDPKGDIHALAVRGQFMGNRGGRFHDYETRTLQPHRRWASRQWICCLTAFKNRHRTVMGQSYTELFFLDEVSAFAAGHRPCFECRRKAATRFAACWAEVRQLDLPPKAGEMDRVLHAQRLDGRDKRMTRADADTLPDGAMIRIGDQFFARRRQQWLQWSWHGYGEASGIFSTIVDLLTPPAIIGALQAGYRPKWHNPL